MKVNGTAVINTINLAFQDSRILDNTYIINYLRDEKMKFRAITFNVSPSHIKNSEFHHIETNNVPFYGVIKNIKSFLLLALYPNPARIPDQVLHYRKYIDYLIMNDDDVNLFFEKLLVFTNIAKEISGNVVMYVTPYSSGVMLYSDESSLQKLKVFSDKMKLFCIKNNITCFDPKISNDEYFIDIVHFNIKGHNKMADVLGMNLYRDID